MQKIAVLTGAGISQESGLATFRGAGGLWNGEKIEEVATPEGFKRDPAKILNFYNQRRKELLLAGPNAAHRALKKLETAYEVYIITQNVDDLHERAGSKSIIHLHGELLKVRSVTEPSEIIPWVGDLSVEDKDSQGRALRPHIVWFGEAVPEMERALPIVKTVDYFLVIGTSLAVYPAADLIHHTQKETKIYLVDPYPIIVPPGVEVIAQKATGGVPRLVERLLSTAIN